MSRPFAVQAPLKTSTRDKPCRFLTLITSPSPLVNIRMEHLAILSIAAGNSEKNGRRQDSQPALWNIITQRRRAERRGRPQTHFTV